MSLRDAILDHPEPRFIAVNPNTYDNHRDEIDGAADSSYVWQHRLLPLGIVIIGPRELIEPIIDEITEFPRSMPKVTTFDFRTS